MAPAPEQSAEDPLPASAFALRGRILRKKNVSPEYLKLALLAEGAARSTDVFVPRNGVNDEGGDGPSRVCVPAELNFLYVGSVVRVRGHVNDKGYRHVEQCELVKCAPNVKLIKETLALPNCLAFASYLGMEDEELNSLLEESSQKGTQKAVVHAIVERLTGQPPKAPPKYRAGRVRRADMEVLERKEAEGRGEGHNDSICWTLCPPCRPLDVNFDASNVAPPTAEGANLPEGAEHSISAHGKLTRGEYLHSKKNRQAAWFIQRLRQYDPPPKKFLDVGGGRGDLAVQIAVHFPEAAVVVVDCNESSVEAGKEYAEKCGVERRIEFRCQNFTEYVAAYPDGGTDKGDEVDCVVALHACGDLSDLALHFVSVRSIPNFIVVPCCYPKRYLAPFTPHWHSLCSETEADALSRLVELDDHREVSQRAMGVVNSMRRSAFDKEEGRDVRLEEFDERISGRNVALVGVGCR